MSEEAQVPDDLAALAARGMERFAPQAWRPGCINCANNHKLATAELIERLGKQGLRMGDPEFMQRVRQALQVGQLFAQNPLAFEGMNGTTPEMIPPVRPADLLVSGNGVCLICFVPQKQTTLSIAPAGWHPGMGA